MQPTLKPDLRPSGGARFQERGCATGFDFSAGMKRRAQARAALRPDPTSLDALDFLVDILRGTHTKDKLASYKAILDRWAGADTTPIALKPEP